MEETWTARYFRDTRLLSIGGGADEVMLRIIAQLEGIGSAEGGRSTIWARPDASRAPSPSEQRPSRSVVRCRPSDRRVTFPTQRSRRGPQTRAIRRASKWPECRQPPRTSSAPDPKTVLVIRSDGSIDAMASSTGEGDGMRHATLDDEAIRGLLQCAADSGFVALTEKSFYAAQGAASSDKFCAIADAQTTTMAVRAPNGELRTVLGRSARNDIAGLPHLSPTADRDDVCGPRSTASASGRDRHAVDTGYFESGAGAGRETTGRPAPVRSGTRRPWTLISCSPPGAFASHHHHDVLAARPRVVPDSDVQGAQDQPPRRQPVLTPTVVRDDTVVRSFGQSLGHPLGEVSLVRWRPSAVRLEPDVCVPHRLLGIGRAHLGCSSTSGISRSVFVW